MLRRTLLLYKRIFSFKTGAGASPSSSSAPQQNPFLNDPRFALEQSMLARPNTFRTSDAFGGGGGDNVAVISGAPISAFRSMLNDVEDFYFQKTKRCRLCGVLALTPREHINIGTHAAHEVLIDVLMPYAMAGESVGKFIDSWSDVLLRSPEFVRLPLRMGVTFEQRLRSCCDLLGSLRDMGYLSSSLMVEGTGRDLAFERIECIGDNTWGSNIAGRMLILFPHMHRHWLGGALCAGFNQLRDVCEANLNLERVYNLLELDCLLPASVKAGKSKFKADVIEALLGELHISLWSFEPGSFSEQCFVDVHGMGTCKATLSTILQHTLNELFDIITLSMLFDYASRVLLILKEAVLVGRHMAMIPPLSSNRSRIPLRVRQAGLDLATREKTITLPPLVSSHRFRRPLVCKRDRTLFPERCGSLDGFQRLVNTFFKFEIPTLEQKREQIVEDGLLSAEPAVETTSVAAVAQNERVEVYHAPSVYSLSSAPIPATATR